MNIRFRLLFQLRLFHHRQAQHQRCLEKHSRQHHRYEKRQKQLTISTVATWLWQYILPPNWIERRQRRIEVSFFVLWQAAASQRLNRVRLVAFSPSCSLDNERVVSLRGTSTEVAAPSAFFCLFWPLCLFRCRRAKSDDKVRKTRSAKGCYSDGELFGNRTEQPLDLFRSRCLYA